jgi:hypothetical protein
MTRTYFLAPIYSQWLLDSLPSGSRQITQSSAARDLDPKEAEKGQSAMGSCPEFVEMVSTLRSAVLGKGVKNENASANWARSTYWHERWRLKA